MKTRGVRLLLVLATLVFLGCGTKPIPQQVTKVQKEPEVRQEVSQVEPAKPSWPAHARFAVVSQDGRTVALMEKRTVVVMVDGVEQQRISSVNMLDPRMVINSGGDYVALYSLPRRGVVLWSVCDKIEAKFVPLREWSSSFDFVEDGSVLRLEEQGRRKLTVPVTKPKKLETRAVVSDNGRVTVRIGNGMLTVIREGKKLSGIEEGDLKNVRINRDGRRLVAYDAAKKKIVILDSETGSVQNSVSASPETQFALSKCGYHLGVLHPGAKELLVLSTYASREAAHLPAVLETYEYQLSDFRWTNVEPESEPCVDLQVKGRGFVVQWRVSGSYWEHRGTGTPYFCLDQAFDFNKDGTLTKYAH